MERYGQYELLTRIATGGMARVFLARHTGQAQLLVVKTILPHLAENEEFVRMFLQEARVAARLDHPNIARIVDLGKIGSSFFIAMEFVHGDDVRHVVRRAHAMGRALPLPLAVRIVADSAAGLHHAHETCDEHGRPLDIVHRDVSPQNLLVGFDGLTKVIDFGIAKAADSSGTTRTGVLKGKYSYMSPEQARGMRLDRRSDVFALGIVLFELCTRTRLFKRPTDLATVNAVTACKVPRPSDLSPEMDPDLEDILLRALAREAAQRTPTAGRLSRELEDYLVQHELPGSHADMARFMAEVWAERLAEEARLGHPAWDTEPGSPDGMGASPLARGDGRRSPPPVESPESDPDPADPALERRARAVLDAALPQAKPRAAPTLELAPVPGRLAVPAPPPLSPLVERGDDVSRIARLVRSRRTGVLLGVAATVVVAVLAAATLRSRPKGSGAVDAGVAPAPTAALDAASVKLDSVPDGATIVVDGRVREEKTPAVLELTTGEEHDVVFSLAGYEDDTVAVVARPGKFTVVRRTLRARDGFEPPLVSPEAGSPPPRAEAAPRPEPPARPAPLPEAAPAAARPAAAPPVVPPATPRPAVARPAEPRGDSPRGGAMLGVESDPPGLAVELDGKPLGRTPVAPQKVGAGKHVLRFLDPSRFLEHSQPITLEAGESRTLQQTFRPRLVRFVVKPSADVLIRGRKFTESPGDAELFPGTYLVTYTNSELPATRTETLVVTADPSPLIVKLDLRQAAGGGTP